MRTLAMISGTVVTLTAVRHASCDRPSTLDQLAQQVIEQQDEEAIEALRAAGPSGLNALLGASDRAKLSQKDRARVDAAIDEVAAQRYGHISRLYWYTDL